MKAQSSGGRPETSGAKKGKEGNILTAELKVVNIGISTFADDLRTQGVEVVNVDWKPPAGGDAAMLSLLEKLGS